MIAMAALEGSPNQRGSESVRTIGCALVLASVVGGTAAHSQERSLWTGLRYGHDGLTGDIYSLTVDGMDFQFGSVSFEPVAGHEGIYRITSPFAKIGPGGQNWICSPSGAQPTYLARIEYKPTDGAGNRPAGAGAPGLTGVPCLPSVLRYPDAPRGCPAIA